MGFHLVAGPISCILDGFFWGQVKRKENAGVGRQPGGEGGDLGWEVGCLGDVDGVDKERVALRPQDINRGEDQRESGGFIRDVAAARINSLVFLGLCR